VPPLQRQTARVLPVNREGQVLLLLGRDPARPNEACWFTIGGGVEAGETAERAAVRELREETGIEVDASQLVGPIHRGSHAFSYGGIDYLSDSTFFAVAVDDVVVSFDGLEQDEIGNVLDAKWWSPAELSAAVTGSDLDLRSIADAAVAALPQE
jgi:8-oxo-dGTP pyrophosphatase MutT (NUDIX family)